MDGWHNETKYPAFFIIVEYIKNRFLLLFCSVCSVLSLHMSRTLFAKTRFPFLSLLSIYSFSLDRQACRTTLPPFPFYICFFTIILLLCLRT